MPDKAGSFVRSLKRRIKREYIAGGYEMGWRLLYSPKETLRGARVAFLAMNPGGDHELKDHAKFDMRPGKSAYVDERWPRRGSDGSERCEPGEAPFQQQVRELFCRIDEKEPHRVLAGNLVPFRSPSWSEMEDKPRALKFGKALWQEIIERAQPSLVIAMGVETKGPLIDILGVDFDKLEIIEIDWRKPDGGSYVAYRGRFPGGIFIHMPHLSRYAIMIKPKYKSVRQKILRGLRIGREPG